MEGGEGRGVCGLRLAREDMARVAREESWHVARERSG